MSINNAGIPEWEGALVVKPATAWRMLGCSNTYGYALLAAGKLDSFRDGRSRKITVSSIRKYITDRLAESKSAGKRPRGRPRKADAQPASAAEVAA
jgi:hypothetical protein